MIVFPWSEQIDWSLLPNNFKMVFKIPIGERTPEAAAKALKDLMNKYNEEVEWKEELPQISSNL